MPNVSCGCLRRSSSDILHDQRPTESAEGIGVRIWHRIGVMQTGKNVGMITMDESLRNLYTQGIASQEEIMFRCEDKQQMKLFFQS